jgi:hypothetical protein
VPAVSVIVPTFQRRELVKRAVASVLAQTYRDLELIVVDDGSTDGTREALGGIDDRVRYRWQPNRGVAAARNAGLRLARGELVAFLDSDDRWLLDHLAVLTTVLHRHREVVLASTCPRFVTTGRAGPGDATVVDPLPTLLVSNTVGFVSCVAVRRQPLLAAGGFDERLSVFEDTNTWQRLAMRGRFAFVRRRTIVHSVTPGSLVARGRRSGAYLGALEQTAARNARALEQLERPDVAHLIERAKGGVRWAQAMQALHRGDRAALAGALADACRLAPELSYEPEFAGFRLTAHLPFTHEPRERLRYCATATELWPDRRTDTARYLRAAAALHAVRLGRLRLAARLLADWPLRGTLGFVRRIIPPLALVLERGLQDRQDRRRSRRAVMRGFESAHELSPERSAAGASGDSRTR